MSELYMMTTITNRSMLPNFLGFYKEEGVTVNLVSLGRGTAASEVMDYFGLESAEKAVMFGMVTEETWKTVKRGLQKRFRIDVPGMGITFLVPLSSIGGRREIKFLTEHQDFVKEEGTLKDTSHELLVVIANQGYRNMVMDAAKSAGAGGGTVIHARGTGMERAESFFGVSLASEKEIIFIVSKTGQRSEIMREVMSKAGMGAKAIIFSLPVTSTAGLRLLEDE